VLAFRLTRRSGKRARLAKPAVRRKQDRASPAVLTELPEFWLKYVGCRSDYVQNCVKLRNKVKKIYLLYFNKIYIRVMKKQETEGITSLHTPFYLTYKEVQLKVCHNIRIFFR
jgi:hypothetical protein